MTRWSEACDCPTIMVGDFNVAPLECDVWSHKQLLTVVSHTPIEVEALTRLQAEQRLGRPRPPFPPGARAPPHLVELPLARLDQERPRPPARPYVGDRRTSPRQAVAPRRPRAVPQLDPAFGPRSARHGVRDLSGGRDVARAIDALRRGWPVADRRHRLPRGRDRRRGRARRLRLRRPGRPADLRPPRGDPQARQPARRRADRPGPDRARRHDRLAEATAVADPALDLAAPAQGPVPHPASSAATAPRGAAIALARRAGLLPALFVDGAAGDGRRRPRRRRHRGVRERAVAQDRLAGEASDPLRRAGGDRRLPLGRRRRRACRPDHRRAVRRAAARPAPQRMPDRRRARLAQMRLRAAARRRARRRSPPRAGASSSTCARRAAASAWSTSCAPMRFRTRASTRSTPISGSASPTTSATSPSPRGCWRALAQDEVRLLTNNPRKVEGLEAAGIRVAERVPLKAGGNPHNRAYLDTKRSRSGHQL